MNVKDGIKHIMRSADVTQAELGNRLGKNQSSIAMYLKNADSMRVDNLVAMLNACGYDLAFIKSDRSDMCVIGNTEEQGQCDLDDGEAVKLFEKFMKWYKSTPTQV